MHLEARQGSADDGGTSPTPEVPVIDELTPLQKINADLIRLSLEGKLTWEEYLDAVAYWEALHAGSPDRGDGTPVR